MKCDKYMRPEKTYGNDIHMQVNSMIMYWTKVANLNGEIKHVHGIQQFRTFRKDRRNQYKRQTQQQPTDLIHEHRSIE